MAFLIAICLLVTTAILWAWIGRVDIIATAQGKIQPTGRVKVIQPIETGRVAEIAVGDGAHVAQGDLLLALDTTAAAAHGRGGARGALSDAVGCVRPRRHTRCRIRQRGGYGVHKGSA